MGLFQKDYDDLVTVDMEKAEVLSDYFALGDWQGLQLKLHHQSFRKLR